MPLNDVIGVKCAQNPAGQNHSECPDYKKLREIFCSYTDKVFNDLMLEEK